MATSQQNALDLTIPSGDVKKHVHAKVDRAEALRYLGHTGQDIDDALLERFEALAEEAQRNLEISYAWRAFTIDRAASSWLSAQHAAEPRILLTDSMIELPGSSINRHLLGARAVVLLACTLGLDSERELRTKNALNATDALMYSAAASSLIEAGADIACGDIERFAREHHLFTGSRFSPGYGDLPLHLQHDLARTLDLKRTLGMTVTQSHLLIPTKSITAIIGLFDKEPDVSFDAPCEGCPAQDGCTYQGKGSKCYE